MSHTNTDRRAEATPGAVERPVPAPTRHRDRPRHAVPLGLFRVVVGLLFAVHGAAALFGWPAATEHAAGPAGTWPSWYAAVIELVGGSLVLLGLGTRVCALICSGSMAFAYFTVHQPHALLPIQNGGEPAVLFCWAFLAIAVTGPGPYALDAAVASLRRSR
jgi:putative oxidoreductase